MAEKDKKFANTNYPGIAADPDEGLTPMSQEFQRRFAEQAQCIGETAQRMLAGSSALVLSTNPLAVRVVRRLFELGMGRVGACGESAVTGAHGMPSSASETSVLKSLSGWVKTEMPWAQFEPYGHTSIDRQLKDMARGFQFIVSTEGSASASMALAVANQENRHAVIAQVAGRKAWLSHFPSGLMCEDCLELPVLEEKGLYFPLLEAIALRVALTLVEAVLDPRSARATAGVLELRDASKLPWHSEALSLAPKAGCAKCKALNESHSPKP